MTIRDTNCLVDRLFRLAFLEGAVTTRGLYERTILSRGAVETGENRSPLTLKKLFRELNDREALNTSTVGEFLREKRLQHGLTALVVHRRLDIPLLTYKMLENDSVSPLNLSLVAWKKIREMWKIPWGELENLIRASHYLTVFRPSYKGTLLRYRRKTSSTYPTDARVSAARELYLRAHLPLPIHEKKSIDRYVRELRSLNSDNANDR